VYLASIRDAACIDFHSINRQKWLNWFTRETTFPLSEIILFTLIDENGIDLIFGTGSPLQLLFCHRWSPKC